LLLSDVVGRAEARLRGPLPEGFIEAFERDRAAEFHDRLKPVKDAAATVRSIRAADIGVCVGLGYSLSAAS
jgi:beta-phosphoglucomutase-like phosphatase (HAD superfamily)